MSSEFLNEKKTKDNWHSKQKLGGSFQSTSCDSRQHQRDAKLSAIILHTSTSRASLHHPKEYLWNLSLQHQKLPSSSLCLSYHFFENPNTAQKSVSTSVTDTSRTTPSNFDYHSSTWIWKGRSLNSSHTAARISIVLGIQTGKKYDAKEFSMLTLAIPMAQRTTALNLVHAIPIPSPESHTGRAILWKPKSKYLAIFMKNHQLALVNDDDFELCINSRRSSICIKTMTTDMWKHFLATLFSHNEHLTPIDRFRMEIIQHLRSKRIQHPAEFVLKHWHVDNRTQHQTALRSFSMPIFAKNSILRYTIRSIS